MLDFRSRMLKAGLITTDSGVTAIMLSFLGGMGPCGPSSLTGFILLTGGFLATCLGVLIAIVGLVLRGVQRLRESNPSA